MTTEPTPSTKLRLFALSGNRCAFPGCTYSFVSEATEKPIFAIAHIKAESPGGPRFDPNQTDDARRASKNLMLLCPNHHALIDRNPEQFPVETLREMKRIHEQTYANWRPSPKISATFAARESLLAQARRIRDDRVSQIVAGDTPVPLAPSPKLVLHVIPATASHSQPFLDVDTIWSKSHYLRPLYYGSGSKRMNADGLLSYVPDLSAGLFFTYVQVFRSGVIEAVDTMILRWQDGDETTANIQMRMDGMLTVPVAGFIQRNRIEEELIRSVLGYVAMQRDLGVPVPIVVLITLLNVKGYMLSQSYPAVPRYSSYGIDRERLQLRELVIEDESAVSDFPATARFLRPAFDDLYQAANWSYCTSYNKEGEWERPQSAISSYPSTA